MMKLFAIIEEQNEQVQSVLIREMLLRAAKEKGLETEIRLHKSGTAAEIPAARRPGDILLYIGGDKEAAPLDKQSLEAGFHGPVILAGREEALSRPAELWQKITAAGTSAAGAASAGSANGAAAAGGAGEPVRHIVAVTSCPTGIAHTFMAAEALQEGAKALGIPLRVETQGSVGAGTPLTPEEIKQADLVIIAADREVDRSRFDGKRIYVSKTKPAISNGKAYIEQAIRDARIQGAGAAAAASAADGEAEQAESKGWFYPPLMNGVSFMLPFVVAGGLLIALSIAFGGMDGAKVPGTFAYYLNQIGAEGAFKLYIPVLAAYIAYAIGDRPALAPGMVGGYIAMNIGAGFIGGIVAGFLAGYIAKYAAKWIRLPKAIAGLNPVLILPLLCTFLTGLIMYRFIGPWVADIMFYLAEWLKGLQGNSAGSIASALILGAVVGGMMAVDVGGPVNKAAYTVSIGLLTMNIYSPMAAALIGGMVPPMALALATLLRPSCFTEKERDSRIATFIMGLAFVSEGAIPFATRNPLRVIPCLIIGSAVAGAVALGFGTGVTVPHGGIFLLLIKGTIIGSSGAPDAMGFIGYFAALIIGMIVSAVLLCIVCRPVAQQSGNATATVKAAA